MTFLCYRGYVKGKVFMNFYVDLISHVYLGLIYIKLHLIDLYIYIYIYIFIYIYIYIKTLALCGGKFHFPRKPCAFSTEIRGCDIFILKAVILTTINVNYVMIDELIHYNYKYNSIHR